MPNHDQRHSIGVARGVEAHLARHARTPATRGGSPPRCSTTSASSTRASACTAASWPPCPARSAGATWPTRGRERGGFTRRVGLYLRHPELGADRIRLAGGPEEAAAWAAAHHDPDRWVPPGSPSGWSPCSSPLTTTERDSCREVRLNFDPGQFSSSSAPAGLSRRSTTTSSGKISNHESSASGGVDEHDRDRRHEQRDGDERGRHRVAHDVGRQPVAEQSAAVRASRTSLLRASSRRRV